MKKRKMTPIEKNNQDLKDAMCTGKKPYNNRARARSQANIDASKFNQLKPLREYKCKFCGKYHLGSTTRIFKQRFF